MNREKKNEIDILKINAPLTRQKSAFKLLIFSVVAANSNIQQKCLVLNVIKKQIIGNQSINKNKNIDFGIFMTEFKCLFVELFITESPTSQMNSFFSLNIVIK